MLLRLPILPAAVVVCVQAAEPPEAVIFNREIGVKMYLPDVENGFYKGVRFDWSGMIGSVEAGDTDSTGRGLRRSIRRFGMSSTRRMIGWGRVTVMASLGGRSSLFADLDGDEDLDLVTSDFNSQPQILMSDFSERQRVHWIEIQLEGSVSNRGGFGATVRVRTSSGTYTKYHDGKSGYLSQSSRPLYFGLGEVTVPERIEVAWPSGRKQTVTAGIAANSVILIREPK